MTYMLGFGVFTAVAAALGSSAAVAATIGAIGAGVTAAAAAAGLGYSIASGEDAKKKQAQALSKQESAQTQAVNAAEGQRKKSEMAINQANRQTPNVQGIMESASASAAGGPSGTMLTGPTGVNPNALSLGKSTLLGG
jgi:hypothetical protein